MSKRGVSDTGAATSPGPSKVQKIAAERGGGSDVSAWIVSSLICPVDIDIDAPGLCINWTGLNHGTEPRKFRILLTGSVASHLRILQR